MWYADEASVAGELTKIRTWWDHLLSSGPAYGYFPNANKTWLLVKAPLEQKARQLFSNTGVNITTEGRRLLGAALGKATFVSDYIAGLVSNFTHHVEVLAEIAKSQPQATFTAFIHSWYGR